MQAFADSFDLYAASADALAGYWDAGNAGNFALATGRFSTSRALQVTSANLTTAQLQKSSGSNDQIHHISFAVYQTATNTTYLHWFTLQDGAASQCSVAFQSNGTAPYNLYLISGGASGTVLATWASAIPALNTWYQFEIEICISNTAGYMNVRRNGNTSNDFASATNLNTRAGTTNSYANRLITGSGSAGGQLIDDLLWRSDPAAVPWVGDIRAYTRMPAADVQKMFTASAVSSGATSAGGNGSQGANVTQYIPFTAPQTGTIASAVIQYTAATSGHAKCALYAASGGLPTTVLATSNELLNPAIGLNTFTFSSPPTVTKGTQYMFATDQDASITYALGGGLSGQVWNTTTYASFPTANPTGTTTYSNPCYFLVYVTPTVNAGMVSEPQQDGVTTYVYDSNPGDNDLYAIAAASGTPASVVCVVTRCFAEKSDAGTRSGAVQLKSGATVVQSTSTALGTSFGWLYRTDLTDPNTGSAWTSAGVSAVNIGPCCTG